MSLEEIRVRQGKLGESRWSATVSWPDICEARSLKKILSVYFNIIGKKVTNRMLKCLVNTLRIAFLIIASQIVLLSSFTDYDNFFNSLKSFKY